ncbi:unnamed protein product [Cladocopium goreaui]|uniref:SUI1 domain-containing protein n=1 Tax=Cladocopium goreaui TaxID=2562237 RepID=A0A9P1GPM0_9DINO|nr:unnamed protein product [Cladocopium goreaui]
MPLRLGSSQAYATNGASEIISSIYTAACGTLWGLVEVHSTIAVTAPRSQRHFATMDGLILEGKDDGKSNKVHIRMQQRNGRKSWTTVAGFPESVRLPKSGKVLQVDFEKILRALKKTFKTNGVLIKDPDHGSVMQLQGDIRKEVAEFLIEVTAIITKDQVMIHGS